MKFTNHGYVVKKTDLNPKQIHKLVKDLTVQPVSEGNFSFAQNEFFKIYRESEKTFRIPRHYGQQHFGIPRLKISDGVTIDIPFTGTLKEETKQPQACAATIKALQSIGGGVLNLSAGFGKTTCALYVVSQMKVKTLIVVHKEFLMNQWRERIQQFLPSAKIGLIRQDKIDVAGKDIVLSMLQSLAMKEYDPIIFEGFGLTIIDETHHICSRVFSQALLNNSTKYMLGLSATPERKDGLTKVLYWFLGEICFTAMRENQTNVNVEVIPFMCDEYLIDPPTNVAGNVSTPIVISNLCEIETRNEVIMNKIKEKLPEGRKIIILSDRRKHCEYLFERCKAELSEYSSGLYMGGMKQDQLTESEKCDAIFATFSQAHEGLDIPALDTCILASPKTDVNQATGRILRETVGKKNDPCIIDIWDRYSVLNGQYKKRLAFYKKSGFHVPQTKKANKKKDVEIPYLFVED
tara:strand:+ start:2512 stop:3900 length:1389 start_codon:yes stop_codon:yes gene_type:complete